MEVSQRDQEMYDYYYGGATLQEVADKYGLTRQRVQQIVVRCGPKRDRVSTRKNRKYDYQAIASYLQENSATVQHTAAHFGCSISTVLNALYSVGVQPAKKVRFTSLAINDIVSRYQAGEKLRLIGESYNTTPQYINTVLRRAGAIASRRK